MTKNIYFIKNRIIVEHQEAGRLVKTEEFLTARAGLSWPSADLPGYFCLLGLKNEPTLTNKKPLLLVEEGEAQLPIKFFEKLTIADKQWYCKEIYADLDDNHKGWEDSFRKFVSERRLEGIFLRDSSGFFDLNHGSLLIRQWERDGALIIPKKTILRNQLSMAPHGIKVEEFKKDFYAIAALTRALLSFEIYPWRDDSLDILTKAREQYDPLRYGLETEIQENPIKFGLE